MNKKFKFKQNYIAIEGPIGVGKSTLVNLLTERSDAVKVMEDVDNPFLTSFYSDRPGSAFQTQIFFLLNRHQQQLELRQRDLFSDLLISDYFFVKDKIFAHITLNDSELRVYKKLYDLLIEDVPLPDLVIYLQAETDTLMKRIKNRGRSLEKSINRDYIDEVNKAYNYFFFHYRMSPLLVIDTTKINFIKDEGMVVDLVRQINQTERGTVYYKPPGA
ncbi:MAG: deoxynucleoside kinase [Acidobacteria bacterium]|nr:deoxynucleoside kinase [Acidobacteriota bacterium]